MSYQTEVAADSPIGYWRLDEAAGASTFVDSSGNGYSATGAGSYTAGTASLLASQPATKSLLNASGRLTVGNQPALQLAALTYEAWVKTTKNDNSYQGVLVKDSAYQIYVRDGKFICHDRGTDRDSGFFVADGNVHHLVIVQRVPPALTSMWADGVKRADVTMGVAAQTQVLALGNHSTGAFPLVGTIDECAVYNGALADARIVAHYQAGIGAVLVPGQINVYNGASWARKAMKVWSGSAWVPKPVKRWTGSAWVAT